MDPSDSAIVTRVKDGDIEANRILVDRHGGRLFGVLMRLLGDPAAAEELAQEAIVKAYLGLDGFRGDAAFGTWLVQIGVHAARDMLRGRQRERRRRIVSLEELRITRPEAADPADTRPGADPGRGLDASEESDRLRRALDGLPDDYRLVLVLKHFEEWSFARIAELTGDSEGSLKVRAHRARKLLRERLAELDRSPGDALPAPGRGGPEVDHG